jgi:hypothetical protein
MSMNTDQPDRRLILTYTPRGRFFPVERAFDDVSDDDMVHLVAGLVGRRSRTKHARSDMEELKRARYDQMAWYADRMIESVYEGGGRWFKLIPLRVRTRIVQMLIDYLRDITATWTDELVAMHAEVARARRAAPVLRPRPAPATGPRVRCESCSASAVSSDEDTLPPGWTANDEGTPRCPEHPAVTLVKDKVG